MVFLKALYEIISNDPLTFPNIDVNMIEFVENKNIYFLIFLTRRQINKYWWKKYRDGQLYSI